METSQIEKILQNPPKHSPPAGLRGSLISAIPGRAQTSQSDAISTSTPWWRRWIPAGAYGVVLISLGAAIQYQGSLIEKQSGKTPVVSVPAPSVPAVAVVSKLSPREELERLRKQKAELDQLRGETQSLKDLLAREGSLREENEKLKKEKAEALGVVPGGEFDQPRTKAIAIACLSQMKQIMIGVRIFELDYNGRAPGDLMQIKESVENPKVLICPGTEPAALPEKWEDLRPSSITYKILRKDTKNPTKAFIHCPVHNHVGLSDGSVQMLGQKPIPAEMLGD